MTDQFQLNEDQLAIQEMARRFTADRITPFAAQWDEDQVFPRDTIKASAELGLPRSMSARTAAGSGWDGSRRR